jgi:hypothetical protein
VTVALACYLARHYPSGPVWATGWVVLLALSWLTDRRTVVRGAAAYITYQNKEHHLSEYRHPLSRSTSTITNDPFKNRVRMTDGRTTEDRGGVPDGLIRSQTNSSFASA